MLFAFFLKRIMKKERLLSIDIFRGLIVFLMIIVNSPGSWDHVYTPLKHANWSGCTLTDLVFPGFIFVSGISTAISLAKKEHNSIKNKSLKIIKRAAIIFIVGLLLNGFPYLNFSLDNYRIFGVLQRISLSLLLAGLLLIYIKNIKTILALSMGLLLLHWAILYYFGGKHPFSLEENASLKIDQWLVGTKHLYQGYGTAFDPEGLLGVLSSAAQLLIGYIFGIKFIEIKQKKSVEILNLFFITLALILAGWIWSFVYPINKSLWTGSYVLFSTGILCCVLIMIEIWVQQNFTTNKMVLFRAFGMNPLSCFVLSQALLAILITPEFNNIYNALYIHRFSPYFGAYLGSFLLAFCFGAFIWILAYILYENRIIIKI